VNGKAIDLLAVTAIVCAFPRNAAGHQQSGRLALHPINAVLFAVLTGTVIMATVATVWSIATGGMVPLTPAGLGGIVGGLATLCVLMTERRAGRS
jgi:hypothetical protein